ncbi:MAG: hypothetical protein ABH885_02635 [Candidatus Omnitrophota bacterium]
MRKVTALAIVLSLSFSFVVYASQNDPLGKLGKGLDNIVYGAAETSVSSNETNSKGTPAFPDCTDKTKDGFGRAVARVVGGIFQIATFWYPQD